MEDQTTTVHVPAAVSQGLFKNAGVRRTAVIYLDEAHGSIYDRVRELEDRLTGCHSRAGGDRRRMEQGLRFYSGKVIITNA